MSRGPARRILGVGLAFATLVAILVALPLPSAPAQTFAAITGDLVTFSDGAFLPPDVRGFCLVLEAGAPTPAYATARARGFPVARGAIHLEGQNQTQSLEVDVREGEQRICLPVPGLTDFRPERLRLTWSVSTSPHLAAVEPLRAGPDEPIPADLGAILEYRKARWRDPRYEYFRWSGRPDILIFDTSGYEVQDRLFKRLAFYVEKTGYTGRVQDFEAIAALHGFNAHDYRAEDLSRFFRAARDQSVDLLPEEAELRDILVAGGVLRQGANGMQSGSGGVVSISRSSSAALRHRFLTHESLHGLYFSSDAFRRGARDVWEKGSEELREFFRLYLSWPDWGYDLTNPYLVVNEFMAYLLQYTEAQATTEILGRGTTWLVEQYPARERWLRRFEQEGARSFRMVYRDLEEHLWREIGTRGGELVALRTGR
jgi:hypothetical protein